MTVAACPQCSHPVGISRWCAACGYDLKPHLQQPAEQGFLPPAEAVPVSFGRPLPAKGFRSPRAAGVVALCLLGLAALLAAAALLLDVLWLIETGRADADFGVHMRLLGRLEDVNDLQLLTLLGAAVGFVVWLYRAYGNLGVLGVAKPRFARGWTIAGWFVPFANLVIPKLLANDVWRAGDPQVRVSPLVHWWWALWLGGSVCGRAALAVVDGAGSLDALRQGVMLDALAQALGMAAALTAIQVIRRATERQESRAAALRAATALPGSA